MSTGIATDHSGQRDSFIWGLQFAAALMMAQQIAGKAARDGLFLQYHGPRGLPAMIAGTAAFSVLLSLSSGALLRRISGRVVLPWALGVSGALQLCEWSLLRVDPAIASIVIYLHMAGLGAVLLSAFWSMLNEEFDPREAKRKFGRIAAGGTAGGLAGGVIAERTVVWSSSATLMLVLAGLHLACGVFFVVLMRTRAAPTGQAIAPAPKARISPHRSPLLVTLAALVLLGSMGAALLDYVFKVYATEAWGKGTDLVREFAFFYTGVALASFVLQTVAAKLLLEKFGLAKTILTLPATLAAGSTVALLAPGVLAAAIARAAEAAVRGSLFRAGYETCYTPVPPAEKRVAKSFIDVGSERGGDAFGAAIIYICLSLAGESAVPWILTIAALLGICSLIVCRTLERTYVKALARNLESRVVDLPMDSNLDLTTRSLVMKDAGTWISPRGTSKLQTPAEDIGRTVLFRQDPVLRQLSALRSGDVAQVRAMLDGSDVSNPLIATQVCLLLGRDEYARLAHAAVVPYAGKVLGLLTDMMLDNSLELTVRRRLPKIIASVPGQRTADALVSGLNDHRFEVRLQCARSLVQASAREPRPALQAGTILAAVDRELAIGKVLWESHRQQAHDPDDSGTDWLDELIREKAHGSLEYVFALLSLIRDPAPVMAAFRSLHSRDRYLRGTALEYLEGILPDKTREMLWDILQERPPKTAGRAKGEIVQELLKSSETVVLHLRDRPGADGKT